MNNSIETIEQVANFVFDVFPKELFGKVEKAKKLFIEHFKKEEVKPRKAILYPEYIEKFVLIKVHDKEFDINNPVFEVFNDFFGYF